MPGLDNIVINIITDGKEHLLTYNAVSSEGKIKYIIYAKTGQNVSFVVKDDRLENIRIYGKTGACQQ